VLKKILGIGFIFLIAGGIVGYYFGQKIFSPNVKSDLEDKYIYIPIEASFENVVDIVSKADILHDIESFKWVAGLMKYDRVNVPSGKFEITPGWSNRDLVSHLRSGQQEPVKLTFNNVRLPEEFAGKVAKYIHADSLEILDALRDEKKIEALGFDSANILSMFLPNTYEFYWNTKIDKFFSRMKGEYDKFWNEDRLAKAKKLNMTPKEVSILASIVQKETIQNSEKPRVAGVYLNRLQKGIFLQADPTVVFANRIFDAKRVLNKHLEFDSPYNTYKYAGLPPGPICMPSIGSIDAVLNAEKHDFIFFCAKPGYNGEHLFAKTLSGHNRNAKVYHQWLREQNIR
jgi:UPF0755 protein